MTMTPDPALLAAVLRRPDLPPPLRQRAEALTAEAVRRARRAAWREDLEGFCQAAVRIKAKDGRTLPFAWSPAQRRLHQAISRQRQATGRVRMLVPKARQLGVSTYLAARFYHGTILDHGQQTFILTHRDDSTRALFAMVKRLHENMPEPLRVAAASDNANALAFAGLDSGYAVGTARATGGGRGMTIQRFHGSEVAFWPAAAEHMAGVMQAVPDSPGTEVVLESTANGPSGLFYDLTMEAARGQGDYRVCFLPWFLARDYADRPPADWQTPEAWRDYGHAHNLTQEQVYWAWRKNGVLARAIGADGDAPCWLFRQEYPATLDEAFQTSGDGGLIPSLLVTEARRTVIDSPTGALVLGVDPARFGDDRTAVVRRQGRRAEVLDAWQGLDTMETTGRVMKLIEAQAPAMVFVDVVGLGAGVVDRLRELGVERLTPVNAAEKPLDRARFANRRAEMWALLLAWLQDPPVDLDDRDDLHGDLVSVGYGYDSNGRLKLESKDDLRKRGVRSPDLADALALTFALPVAAPESPRGTRRPDRRRASWMSG